jgi:hypothetical protein
LQQRLGLRMVGCIDQDQLQMEVHYATGRRAAFTPRSG